MVDHQPEPGQVWAVAWLRRLAVFTAYDNMICTHILLCSALSLSFVLRLRPPHWRGCLSCCFLSLLRFFSFFLLGLPVVLALLLLLPLLGVPGVLVPLLRLVLVLVRSVWHWWMLPGALTEFYIMGQMPLVSIIFSFIDRRWILCFWFWRGQFFFEACRWEGSSSWKHLTCQRRKGEHLRRMLSC